MVNKPRIKGTFAETAVVNYLQVHGFPYAERRSLKGALDRGDVTGCPGLCFEVKYAGITPKIGPWLEETGVERLNAGADYGILVVKPMGLGEGSVGSWYAVMLAEHFNQISNLVTLFQEGGLVLLHGEPTTYSTKTLRWELSSGTKRLASNEVLALTLRPPGTKDDPGRWYRVCTLEHMVKLLRYVGYGSPLALVVETSSVQEASL